jgi:SNF2 family DNA or RNA helicase
MIRILSKICALEGWDCLQYTGTQSIDRRDKVLRQFAATPSCRILLASLRAGGTGLNLTCASRVLLVDLWWNASVEQQAFARTYRRGQEKETRMTRLITADSVDTDLVQMQERKEEEIQGVLNAPEARKKMSMQELLGLFGTVNQDEDGRTFVIVDDGTKGRAERVGEEEDDDGGRFGRRNWARKR